MPPLEIPPRFKKALRKKDASMQGRILECVARLQTNPRHPGLQVHKMKGHDGIWEAYVDAKNRVTFCVEGDAIVMLNHCNHDFLFRNPR